MATQAEVAQHLFISDRQVRNLITDGVFAGSRGKGGLNLDDCRKRYLDYLRGQKTGQVKTGSDPEGDAEPGDLIGGINVAFEDARKKKLDADTREFKLNQLRSEYVPVELLTYSIGSISEMLVSNLQSLPMKMKVADPSITARSIDKAKREIADLCNEIADFDIDLSDYTPSDQEIDQPGPEGIQNSEAADGGGVG